MQTQRLCEPLFPFHPFLEDFLSNLARLTGGVSLDNARTLAAEYRTKAMCNFAFLGSDGATKAATSALHTTRYYLDSGYSRQTVGVAIENVYKYVEMTLRMKQTWQDLLRYGRNAVKETGVAGAAVFPTAIMNLEVGALLALKGGVIIAGGASILAAGAGTAAGRGVNELIGRPCLGWTDLSASVTVDNEAIKREIDKFGNCRPHGNGTLCGFRAGGY